MVFVDFKDGGDTLANKDSRIKHNLISSFIYQLVLISLSFLLPRLYLENFGSEVNGVLSTIKQIFTYMCLLEAGVGLATTQALSKRIGKNDFESASRVLSATNIYYIKTGIIYSIIVLIIAFFVTVYVRGQIVRKRRREAARRRRAMERRTERSRRDYL